MTPANDDSPFDGDEEDLSEALQAAGDAIMRFSALLRRLDWFGNVGAPLGSAERATAEAYVAALGFPDVDVVGVEDWDEAAALAEGLDVNDTAWDAEEQLRAALTQDATDRFGEEDLALVMAHLGAQAAPAIQDAIIAAARAGGVRDEALLDAAIGAATLACHQAALVLLADAEEDHPFALKFRLVEAGRWPLGIIGGTFNLF
jgi:hypothetical protein